MDHAIWADGLQVPEGPVAMPDGSVLVVEIMGGRVTRCRGDTSKALFAEVGGGPNGLAIGPGGSLFVANNGGYQRGTTGVGGVDVTSPAPPEPGPCIQRVDPTGQTVERWVTHASGTPLRAPNDLVFDRDGGLWFTDFGRMHPSTRDWSSLCYVPPGEREATRHVDGVFAFNGIALSPDEKTIYATDTYAGRLWAWDLSEPGVVAAGSGRAQGGRVVYAAPDSRLLDSIAVQEDGAICIGSIYPGGVLIVRPDGDSRHVDMPDSTVTNICFGGVDRRDAFVTMAHTGQLLHTRWDVPGLPLNFTDYD